MGEGGRQLEEQGLNRRKIVEAGEAGEAGETGEAREAETEKMREARVIRDQRRTKEQ